MIVSILANAESLLVGALIIAIIVQSLASFFAPGGMGKFSLLLYDLTDPILAPLRRAIPPIGMLDLSPMIAILLLIIFGGIIQNITLRLA